MNDCLTDDYLSMFAFLLEMEADQFSFVCFTSQPDLHAKKQQQKESTIFPSPQSHQDSLGRIESHLLSHY